MSLISKKTWDEEVAARRERLAGAFKETQKKNERFVNIWLFVAILFAGAGMAAGLLGHKTVSAVSLSLGLMISISILVAFFEPWKRNR